ncbi:hypothetical protein GCM10022255_063600 [Dactylosporangium darangshiense]|uniref:Uncharacterized protein n=1 Tax=Dactylosporangium darangshiense TaxID=579108 RepID=A0ABP8DGB9_9ACTN
MGMAVMAIEGTSRLTPIAPRAAANARPSRFESVVFMRETPTFLISDRSDGGLRAAATQDEEQNGPGADQCDRDADQDIHFHR